MSKKVKGVQPNPNVFILPATVGNVKTKGKRTNRKRKNGGGQKLLPGGRTSQVVRPSLPEILSIKGRGDGRIRVTHREYVCSIAGTTGYNVRSYSINPSLRVTFPWLAQLAKLYESYLFKSLVFEFVPSCPTTTSGTVMLAMDFDAFDSPPANKQGMMSSHLSVSGQPFERITINSDQPDLEKFGVQRFTRQSTLAQNLDIKTYDVCNLFIGTNGQANTVEVGDVYVYYTVDLMTPQDPIWLVDPADCSLKILSNVDTQTLASPLLGATKVGDSRNEMFSVDAGGSLNFLAVGEYILDFMQGGTGITGAGPTITAAAVNTLTILAQTAVIAAASTTAASTVLVKVLKAPCVATVTNTGRATTITSTVIRAASYLSSLV